MNFRDWFSGENYLTELLEEDEQGLPRGTILKPVNLQRLTLEIVTLPVTPNLVAKKVATGLKVGSQIHIDNSSSLSPPLNTNNLALKLFHSNRVNNIRGRVFNPSLLISEEDKTITLSEDLIMVLGLKPGISRLGFAMSDFNPNEVYLVLVPAEDRSFGEILTKSFKIGDSAIYDKLLHTYTPLPYLDPTYKKRLLQSPSHRIALCSVKVAISNSEKNSLYPTYLFYKLYPGANSLGINIGSAELTQQEMLRQALLELLVPEKRRKKRRSDEEE